jgi:hypothetical protein
VTNRLFSRKPRPDSPPKSPGSEYQLLPVAEDDSVDESEDAGWWTRGDTTLWQMGDSLKPGVYTIQEWPRGPGACLGDVGALHVTAPGKWIYRPRNGGPSTVPDPREWE